MSSKKSYAISDIHGYYKTFKKLVEDVISLKKEDTLYLLGDLIDRGPNTKGVLDYCMELISNGYQLVCLRGNHEQMLLDSISKSKAESAWLSHGGRDTLNSFGIISINQLEKKYFDFLNSFDYYLKLDDYVLVHAGLNFSSKKPFEDKFAMLWSRYLEVDSSKIGGRKVVHGHTPFPLKVILNQNFKFEDDICIDGGCPFEKIKEGTGYLVALELNEQSFFYQKNID